MKIKKNKTIIYIYKQINTYMKQIKKNHLYRYAVYNLYIYDGYGNVQVTVLVNFLLTSLNMGQGLSKLCANV